MYDGCNADAAFIENGIALCDYHEQLCDDAHELYHPDDGE